MDDVWPGSGQKEGIIWPSNQSFDCSLAQALKTERWKVRTTEESLF